MTTITANPFQTFTDRAKALGLQKQADAIVKRGDPKKPRETIRELRELVRGKLLPHEESPPQRAPTVNASAPVLNRSGKTVGDLTPDPDRERPAVPKALDEVAIYRKWNKSKPKAAAHE